eukprot:gene7989-16344_t
MITISSHTIATAIAVSTAILCFVPNMLNMDIEPYVEDVSSMPLANTLESLPLRYSLVASAAAMFPVILQILFGMISGDPLSASYHDLIPKLFAILSILIPDLIFLLELCPSNNFEAVAPLFCARTIFLFASCLVFISSYPARAWTPLWVNIIIGLFSAGEVLSSASAFAPTENIYTILLAIKLVCRIACVIIYVWRLYLWVTYISAVKLEAEDYVAAFYLTVLITVSLGACVLNVIFSNEHWYQKDANFFTGGVYASSILVTIFMLINELIFKYEVSALQQSQIRAIKLILIGYFSHRMRSPLNTVAVGLAFITKHFRKQLEGDMGDVVKEAASCCSLSIQILDNLQLYQKMDAGVVSMFPKKLYFKSFIEDAMEPFWLEVKDKSIVLLLENIEDPLLDSGRITVTVEYKSRLLKAEAVNALKGKADPDRLEGLFRESLHFKPGEDMSNKGSGLSLWISKRIIDTHKQFDMTVSSEGNGRGSTFVITMPCYMAEQHEYKKQGSEDNLKADEESDTVDPEEEKMETYSQASSNRALSRADAQAIEQKVNNRTDGSFIRLFGPSFSEDGGGSPIRKRSLGKISEIGIAPKSSSLVGSFQNLGSLQKIP